MKSIFFLISIILFFSSEISAQKGKVSWQKRAKMAADLEKSGDLKQAANYYASIHKEKPDKLEFSYKAGKCYLELRDYKNAAQYLAFVKEENEKYDKPGYKYALALKQSGLLDEAKIAFDDFLTNYQGEDKAVYQTFIENEIKGCNYALKAQEHTDPLVSLAHLDTKINSSKTEFAPIPFANNILYFSSTRAGVAKIYRAIKKDEEWSAPQIPSIFLGKMEHTHFGNGSFTENGKRFFFTQCDIIDSKPQCAIYLMEDLGEGKWSNPMILPDYINPPKINTTHPLIITVGNQEILYFSSNRPGGRGGLDLWYSSRPINGDLKSFTLPKNLGRNINSYGDEISPFYHQATGTLYFSSNGRVSAGGLDIFKSKGEKLQWEVAQNMGFPINSSADDLYYTLNEAHGGGYLVSNRSALPQRQQTTDDDIFYFKVDKIDINIHGIITQAGSPQKGLLKDINIKLFKKTANDDEELVDERMLVVGEFDFKNLEARTNYVITISKEDYQETSLSITTGNQTRAFFNEIELAFLGVETLKTKVRPQDIRHYIMAASYNSNDNAYLLPANPIDPKTGEDYQGDTLEYYYEFDAIAGLGDKRMLYYNNDGIPQPYNEPIIAKENIGKNTSPIVQGPYAASKISPNRVAYKIQVSAVRKFRPDKYDDLKEIGRLVTEDIDGGIKRILVINKDKNKENIDGFKRKSDALNALSYVLNNTSFKYAFVIKYVDGKRIGEGFRGWDEEEGLETETKPDGSIPKEVYEGF